jgi:hypothetical protein
VWSSWDCGSWMERIVAGYGLVPGGWSNGGVYFCLPSV